MTNICVGVISECILSLSETCKSSTAKQIQ